MHNRLRYNVSLGLKHSDCMPKYVINYIVPLHNTLCCITTFERVTRKNVWYYYR